MHTSLLPEHPHPADLPAGTVNPQPDWSHLLMIDRRTVEERTRAALKESARRKGRGRNRWWESAD